MINVWSSHKSYFGISKSLSRRAPRIASVTAVPTVELDAQYRALREEAGLLERTDRAWLEVGGTEGAEFLQGQLTNDIEGLGEGEGCYAALLDRKGRMRADMRVLRLAPALISIETGTATVDDVHKHLEMYKIGRDVELEWREGRTLLALVGPRSSELLGGLPLGAEHSHRELRIADADVRAVTTDPGVDLLLDRTKVGSVAAELERRGAAPVGLAASEIVRVEAGRPAFGSEMTSQTIPQEAGINERAVDFDKGCYIGQETVARLHYKGKPNRHLRRLVSKEELEAGEPVRLGDRALGEIGTAVLSPARGPLALAILRREAEPGAEVTVGEGKAATVEAVEA
jgi:folate-binding protein YgfZ